MKKYKDLLEDMARLQQIAKERQARRMAAGGKGPDGPSRAEDRANPHYHNNPNPKQTQSKQKSYGQSTSKSRVYGGLATTATSNQEKKTGFGSKKGGEKKRTPASGAKPDGTGGATPGAGGSEFRRRQRERKREDRSYRRGQQLKNKVGNFIKDAARVRQYGSVGSTPGGHSSEPGVRYQ